MVSFDSAEIRTTCEVGQASPCDEPPPPAAAKRYRVIFNCDGNAVFKDAQGDTDQWIENLFGPLDDSHVDALFWCDGAGGNTASYDSKVLELTGQRVGKVDPHLQKLIAEGNDPPRVIVREARKRKLDVFYSFRINDIHDAFLPEELPTFKVEHPEWLIGERRYGTVTSFRTALNFAVPEVRDLKFRVIEEIFQKYDFDGLEIDFLRSAPYFLPGEEDKNAHLLPELLQRERGHLNKRAKERGLPIRLAVRVDESLKACRLNGFDVPAWLDKGLIDLLVLGSGVIDIEVEEFKKLAAPKGVFVYPCLYGWPSQYRPISAELAAGLALNYWSQGADGIYLFNWFPHPHNNSEKHGAYMTELLKQLGDPAVLRAQQPRLMFAADRGRPQPAYQYNWLHCVLPAELPPNETVRLTMRVGTSFGKKPPARLTSRLAVDKLQNGDELRVELNGKLVERLDRLEAGVLVAALAPEQVTIGVNQLSVTATRLNGRSKDVRMLTAAEIQVELPRIAVRTSNPSR